MTERAGKHTEQLSFDAFFASEYPSIVAVAVAVCGSFPAGEEAAQDAMAEAARRWEHVSALDRPGAWVRRVAINRALNHRRESRRRESLSARLLPDHVASAPTDHPADERLWRAMARLSDDQRSVLALVEVDGYQPHELAVVLGCSAGAARVRLHRARVALRAEYERIEDDQ